MRQTVIITGADGFLGGKIVKRLLNDTDFNILGLTLDLDRPTLMMERENLAASDRIRFMTNDEFLDPRTELDPIYGAVHLAFSRRMQPAEEIASSIVFASAVFRRLVNLNADRVINMSSQGIYGNTSKIRTENTAPAPATQYTMAKYAAEVLFQDIMCDVSHHTNFRLDPVTQSQNVVKGLCASAKEGAISLNGGKQVFSFLDAEDVSSAVSAMLMAEGDWDSVYNVGWNQKRYSLLELAEAVADSAERRLGRRPEISLVESDTELWAGMDSSRFMNKTKWKPQVTLSQTLDSMF